MLTRILVWLGLKKRTSPVKDLSTQQLTAICDAYWNDLSNDVAPTNAIQHSFALKELCTRGSEMREWARGLLTHTEYYAREQGAFLLGELGRRGLLADAKNA